MAKKENVMLLLNSFSLNMLASLTGVIHVQEISLNEARDILANGFTSAVGHADTAAVYSSLLGIDVPTNRQTVTLHETDSALVGQYKGPRLPEGATTLPDGAEIVWVYVQL